MEKFDFMKKFRPEDLCIKEFKYWLVCVRRKQTTLGDAVIILKREATSVSEMKPEEGQEFPEVVKWYEKLCKKKFEAIKFNYIIMMMHDPCIHYHAFPRYNKEIELFNRKWEDDGDKNTLNNFSSTEVLDDNMLFKIRDYMCDM